MVAGSASMAARNQSSSASGTWSSSSSHRPTSSRKVSPSYTSPRTWRMPGFRRYSTKPSFFARPIIRVFPDQVWVYSSRQPRSSQYPIQAVRALVPQPPDQ